MGLVCVCHCAAKGVSMHRDRNVHQAGGFALVRGCRGGVQGSRGIRSHLGSLRTGSASFPGEIFPESPNPFLEGNI